MRSHTLQLFYSKIYFKDTFTVAVVVYFFILLSFKTVLVRLQYIFVLVACGQ